MEVAGVVDAISDMVIKPALCRSDKNRGLGTAAITAYSTITVTMSIRTRRRFTVRNIPAEQGGRCRVFPVALNQRVTTVVIDEYVSAVIAALQHDQCEFPGSSIFSLTFS